MYDIAFVYGFIEYYMFVEPSNSFTSSLLIVPVVVSNHEHIDWTVNVKR